MSHIEPTIRITRRPTYNFRQVMDLLECSKSQVYKLCAMGRIESFKNGSDRGLRIYIDSVQRYIQREQP